MSPVNDADILKEFVIESYENLDRLDRELVILENDPTDRETLASIFRTIHTIKGSSGFLALGKLEAVTHVGENLLSRMRDGKLTLNPEITTALLALVDAVREILASIDSTGQEGERDDRELIGTLARLLEDPRAENPPPTAITPQPDPPKLDDEPAAPMPALGKILIERGIAKPSDIADAIERQEQGDPRRLGEILVEQQVAKPHEVLEALQAQQAAKSQSATESTIRVDVSLLDGLMNLVGELVLARNQILQYTHTLEENGLLGTTQRLDQITSELQEGVMKTRLQPIGNIWSKFPRTVRDVALGGGKQVRIEMEGKETELDKTIIEAIKDPLTHLLRNAVDHGIERPEIRAAAGKTPEGKLHLRAFHEGGQVIIEISDDGAGLDPERIRRKAIQNSLISAEQAARMKERETINLIFVPGFSTAEKVTNVSGRGVGMDVVKTNIEKIGGTVDVQSKLGAGTTVRMKIPLTLAIIPALIVRCAGDRYAIPQASLLELVRVEPEQIPAAIENVHGAPVYRLREKLLPLMYLNRELGVEEAPPAVAPDAARDAANGTPRAANIVVLHADGRQFGLIVDEVSDTEEIVVKPLGGPLKEISVYAGATIMGDGGVALILDVLGLAQRAHVLTDSHDRMQSGQGAETATNGAQKKPLLVFLDEHASRMAIPLGLVARLEEFSPAALEFLGDREVLQYRGEIMPIIRLGDVIEDRRSRPRAQSGDAVPIEYTHHLQIVVFSIDGRRLGLLVARILDIVDEDVTSIGPASREGVHGSLVIHEKVTELMDLEFIARRGMQRASAPPVIVGREV
ncbi:MAG: chemotaxis protein CheA [Candidatus Acidiferrales bacterium]